MITVRTYRNTPVYYRGETYRVTNLEIGDRIRVEADARNTPPDEISARRIDVTASVQDSGTALRHRRDGDHARGTRDAPRAGTRLRVRRRRPRRNARRHALRRGCQRRGHPRARSARRRQRRDQRQLQPRGRHVPGLDGALRFRLGTTDDRVPPREELTRYAVVTITGTITETLEDGPTLGFRDRDTNTRRCASGSPRTSPSARKERPTPPPNRCASTTPRSSRRSATGMGT